MNFIIDPKIFEKFPNLHVGIIVAKNVVNTGISEELLQQLREVQIEIRSKIEADILSEHPKIKVWRDAYTAFGGKPKENKSSVENLYRLILRGADVRHINKLVDSYNLISIKHMVPAGGEDLDKIQGDLRLAFATGNEPPVLLLGDKEARPPHEGEVIYKDSISAICRRWNWREADRTKLTEETTNAILVIEALPPTTLLELQSSIDDLDQTIKKNCSAVTSKAILSNSTPEALIY